MKKNTSPPLLIIGQDIHIMNPDLIQTLEQQDSRRLELIAEKQVAAGAHALDLNLGPAKKNCGRINWSVQVIQNTVNVPLFISSRVLDQPEILNMHKGTAAINSVTADPATLADTMKLAKEYDAELVVLLVRPGLTPFTVDERLHLAADVLETASRVGFPFTQLYLDPLFHLRPDPMTWQLSRGLPDIGSVLQTIERLPPLAGENVRSLVALSSASQLLPSAERPGLHHRLLPMLAAAGLDAVILNCHDKKLMDIARNPDVSMEDRPPSMPQLTEDLDTATLPW